MGKTNPVHVNTVNNLVTCRCQHCDGGLEFDADELDPENRVVDCPHCKMETVLYKPSKTPPPPRPSFIKKTTKWLGSMLEPYPLEARYLPAKFVCTRCYLHCEAIKKTKGNTAIEVFLYFLWIAPGIIYSIWRRSNLKDSCQACGSTDIIPDNTHRAKEILSSKPKDEE